MNTSGRTRRADAEQPERGAGFDPRYQPVEVHPEEAGDERQRQEDRRDDRQPVGGLVELRLKRVGERLAGGVDPLHRPVELAADPVEVVLAIALEGRDVLDLLADPLEQRPLRPDPHPQVREPLAQAARRLLVGGARPEAARQQPRLELGDLVLDRRQRVEHRVGHPVERDVDGVLLALAGRELGHGAGEVELLLVDGEQVVAVEDDVHPQQHERLIGAALALRGRRAPEREHDQVLVDVDLAGRGAAGPEARQRLGRLAVEPENGRDLLSRGAAVGRQIDPEELAALAQVGDPRRVELAQRLEPSFRHRADSQDRRRSESRGPP